jgi:hypothetical protein
VTGCRGEVLGGVSSWGVGWLSCCCLLTEGGGPMSAAGLLAGVTPGASDAAWCWCARMEEGAARRTWL